MLHFIILPYFPIMYPQQSKLYLAVSTKNWFTNIPKQSFQLFLVTIIFKFEDLRSRIVDREASRVKFKGRDRENTKNLMMNELVLNEV